MVKYLNNIYLIKIKTSYNLLMKNKKNQWNLLKGFERYTLLNKILEWKWRTLQCTVLLVTRRCILITWWDMSTTLLEWLNVFKKILKFIFREGKRGRKKGRETSMCGWLSCAPYWGPEPQPRHLSGNGIPDPLVRRLALNLLSHTSQGRMIKILKTDYYQIFSKEFPCIAMQIGLTI